MKSYQILGIALWGIVVMSFGQLSYANGLNEPYFAKPLSSQNTFKDKRDANLTKQDVDYSCGASSLSTILTYFYQTPKTEAQILADMALKDVMASFLDLAKVSEKYGFFGRGLMMDYDTLLQMKIPAIVYLNHKRSDHFSVVRAIDSRNVYLADSSWGNRTLTRRQFENMWLTSTDGSQGKVLLILPNNDVQKSQVNKHFTAIVQTQDLLMQTPNLFRNFPQP